jgi:hypothetical protein
MAIAAPPPVARAESDSRILLRNVPWSVYVTLVEEPANDHVRMTYDRGTSNSCRLYQGTKSTLSASGA